MAIPSPNLGLPFTHKDTSNLSSRRIGVLIFVAGFLVAALFAFVIYPRQSVIEANIDVNGYGALSQYIARGEGFSQSAGPTLRRAPLYPYFVAGLLRLSPHNLDSLLPQRILYRPILFAQCLMVGFTCLAVWTLARKLFHPRTALLAAALCLVTPMVMRYVGSVEVETLMALLITLMALTGFHLYERPTIRNSVLFGFVCGLAALTKSIVLLYPFAFLAMLWFLRRKQVNSQPSPPETTVAAPAPSRLLTMGASSAWTLIVFGLCLLPWTIRNYRVSSGRFINVSSNGPAEFLRGYINAQPKFILLHQDFGGADPTRLSWEQEASRYEQELIRPYGLDMAAMERSAPPDPDLLRLPNVEYELRKEAVESAEMKRRLLHEPSGFVAKFVAQLATFWYIVETRGKSCFVGGFALLALGFAVFGWHRARAAHPGVWVIVFTILYFNIVYAVFLAFARYSMPLYPILLILTAAGIREVLPKPKHHG